jgi:hypothetical protein
MLLLTEREEMLREGASCLGFSKTTLTSGHLTLLFLSKDATQIFISVKKEDESYRSVFFEIYVLYSLFTDAD